jgi:type IV secretory pathway TraG/TraD family ATPase VirD4
MIMKLFNKQSWFGKRTEQYDRWDSRFRILDLTGAGDWLTLGDLFTGIGVFGATGSGKTSSLATIAHALMVMDCGFVWMAAKSDEIQLVTRIAAKAGRSADLIVIGDDANGVLSPHRFNPLAYEAGIVSTGTGSVVQYLSDCAKVLSHKDGTRGASAEGERFWIDQFDRLIRQCIDTAKFAGRPLSVDLLRKIQLSAPKNQAELEDDRWAAESVCWRCLTQADERRERGLVSAEDIERVIHFWTNDYMRLDVKPRSSIDVMFAVLVDAFYAEEPLRSILTTTTTVTPDDVIEGGKIVVLSLPTNVYHSAGRMAQFCFKLSFQRAMLRRRKDAKHLQRPCVLWVDEAHAFAHPFDAQYFAEVRSNRGISVFMDQGIGGYMRALGLSHPDEVDGFLQNLATKFFFQNNSPATNLFAADAIGRMLTDIHTSSLSASLDGSQFGQSTTQEERHQISSGVFGFLKRGGPDNARIVQGYVLKPGIFNATGTNVARCNFVQTDLTR